MNKRTPEALIANLRRRRLRIIFYSIAIVVLAVLAAAHGYLTYQGVTTLIINPETEDVKTETASLAATGPLMAACTASCYSLCLFFAIGLGSAFAGLIIELTTYTKDQLLVEMWDRIKEIQSKIDKQAG